MTDDKETISVLGARVHNLKNIQSLGIGDFVYMIILCRYMVKEHYF